MWHTRQNVDEKKRRRRKKSSPMLPVVVWVHCVVTAESWCCGYCRCRCCLRCRCDDCWLLLYFLFIISSSSSLLCVAKLLPLSFALANVSVLFWNFFFALFTYIDCVYWWLAGWLADWMVFVRVGIIYYVKTTVFESSSSSCVCGMWVFLLLFFLSLSSFSFSRSCTVSLHMFILQRDRIVGGYLNITSLLLCGWVCAWELICRCVAIVVVLIGIIICYLSCAILFSLFPTQRASDRSWIVSVCLCVSTNVSPRFRCVRAPYTCCSIWNVCLCSLCKHSHVHTKRKETQSERETNTLRREHVSDILSSFFFLGGAFGFSAPPMYNDPSAHTLATHPISNETNIKLCHFSQFYVPT